MTPALYAIEFFQGAKYDETFTITNPDGTPYSFTGKSAELMIRPAYGQTSIIVVSSATGSGTRLVLASGSLRIYITKTTMATLTAQNYVYDLDIIPTNTDDTETWLYGPILLRGI